MTDKKRLFRDLLLANFFIFIGFGAWQAMFNNFAVDELGLSPVEVGINQSLREIPGLLGFGFGILALWLRKTRLLALSILALGAGVFITGHVNSLGMLIVATLVMSFGFHYSVTATRSIALGNFSHEDTATYMGRFAAASSLGFLLSAGAVFVMLHWLTMQQVFWIMGAVTVLVGGYSLFISQKSSKPKKKKQFVFRKKYSYYYCLMFLDGCRRHVFTTFAPFLLVKEFGISAITMAALFFISNALGMVLNWKWMGRIINRYGERNTLLVNYACICLVFAGYMVVEDIRVAYVLYVVDGLFFGASMAIVTYFQKIADPEDITPQISTGQSINHITAVIIPITGGLIWEYSKYEYTFLIGIVIVMAAWLVSLGIIRKKTSGA